MIKLIKYLLVPLFMLGAITTLDRFRVGFALLHPRTPVHVGRHHHHQHRLQY